MANRNLDFAPYTVLRHPLPERDDRVWDTKRGPGVTTGSHDMKLARSPRGELVALVEHGGGREVVGLGSDYMTEHLEPELLAMSDRALYVLLYGLTAAARDAASLARQETANRYGLAFLQGRMKKRRRGNTLSLDIKMGWFPKVGEVEHLDRCFPGPEEAHAEALKLASLAGKPLETATAIGRA